MFEIGDIIIVANIGHTYSTYMDMAAKLGAEINPEDWNFYGKQKPFGYTEKSTKSTKSTKWTYGKSPSRGGFYIVKNISDSGKIHLIEHTESGNQFLMSAEGMRFHAKVAKIYLEDDLFEL